RRCRRAGRRCLRQAQALVISAKLAGHNRQRPQAVEQLLKARAIARSTGDRLVEIAVETALIEARQALNRPTEVETSRRRATTLLQEVAATLNDPQTQAHFLTASPLAVELARAGSASP
ncbi:MAG: hypothetical protein ACE5G8_12780, partial [Anaerolineae bacterium]